jgi:hypothetical protein
MAIENTNENSSVPQPALRLNSTQRQSMPVINGHHPKLELPTGKLFRCVRSISLSNVGLIQGKNNFSTTTRRRVVRFARDQRQSMPVSKRASTSNRKIHFRYVGSTSLSNVTVIGKFEFPPPLGDGSSDFLAANDSRCPLVTGVATNDHENRKKLSIHPDGNTMKFTLESHRKAVLSTTAQLRVVRFSHGRR